MNKLVFLLEERSMKVFLEGFLPRILPEQAPNPILLAHEGKSDLRKSIQRKLSAWREPGVAFVIVHDQDEHDCRALKRELLQLCPPERRAQTLVRIPCHELEAWFIGDIEALSGALGEPKLRALARRSGARAPDAVPKPSELLRRELGYYAKVESARAMGPLLDVDRCGSPSLRAFVSGVQRILYVGSEDGPASPQLPLF